MPRFVNEHGGNLVRCMEAINGFKQKYNIWPSHLHIAPGTLYTLVNHHLTEEGFERLCRFMTLVVEANATIKTTAPDNRVFDYSIEGWNDDKNPDINIENIIFS